MQQTKAAARHVFPWALFLHLPWPAGWPASQTYSHSPRGLERGQAWGREPLRGRLGCRGWPVGTEDPGLCPSLRSGPESQAPVLQDAGKGGGPGQPPTASRIQGAVDRGLTMNFPCSILQEGRKEKP